VRGATVLDLYAGSGALAIEALSRGAARAVLVDRDRAADAAIRSNLDATGLADAARVHRVGVPTFLTGAVPEAPFDLVFLDPPYDLASEEVGGVLADLGDRGLVVAGATVVIERPRTGSPVVLPPGWGTERERAYGDTLLVIAHTG